jgi:hypothetical protein
MQQAEPSGGHAIGAKVAVHVKPQSIQDNASPVQAMISFGADILPR